MDVKQTGTGIKTTPGVYNKPFFISIPHSGEMVPSETPWLKNLNETLLMYDVDRYVDRLYAPVIESLRLPSVKTEWHRYAVDLNRLPDDVDVDSVQGSQHASGTFPRGLHWAITTAGEKLLSEPMTGELHDQLVYKYFEPFHVEVRRLFSELKMAGAKVVYHIDAHSMPSVGTSEHLDPGERRADVVVSDCDGKSCSTWFKDLVLKAYQHAGFKTAYNWPYKGGRVTQTYGQPSLKQESIQVEFNRALYMDEATKHLRNDLVAEAQRKIQQAIQEIYASLPDLVKIR